MQFFKSTVIFVFAFAALAAAAPGAPTVDAHHHTSKKECKPLLQSCKTWTECCADLCVLGVSNPPYL